MLTQPINEWVVGVNLPEREVDITFMQCPGWKAWDSFLCHHHHHHHHFKSLWVIHNISFLILKHKIVKYFILNTPLPHTSL
jgi:hypothetical protein